MDASEFSREALATIDKFFAFQEKPMLPFRKIVCPTDFSDVSYQALETAIQVAQDFDAELCVVHITAPAGGDYGLLAYGAVEYAPVAYVPAELDEESVKIAKSRLAELIQTRVPKGIKVRGLTRMGNAAEEIEYVLEKEKADLLVIATRGLSGWRHLVFGSVTERTVRMSACPVLAVHDRSADEEKKPLLPLRKILCPTDFSEPSRLALSSASELAQRYHAELSVLHVEWTLSERSASGEYEIASYDRLKLSEGHAKLCELIAEETPTTLSAHPVVRVGNTAEEIERAAEEANADLIVIATHGASGWHRLFYGSVAEQVLRVTKFPILVIHAPAAIAK
jgi:nucleotide-binding universal stress UspA family protein